MISVQIHSPARVNALTHMDRHTELFPSNDPEAYDLRALINDNLGNHEEAEQDRRLAK